MTLSEDFAICPWCDREDSIWPEYHNESVKEVLKRECEHCRKPYLSIMTIKFMTIPVCEHDKKQFGDSLQHPVCHFETKKII